MSINRHTYDPTETVHMLIEVPAAVRLSVNRMCDRLAARRGVKKVSQAKLLIHLLHKHDKEFLQECLEHGIPLE